MIEFIYFALGFVVGASALFLFLVRDAPTIAQKRAPIPPEAKVVPMHVFERIGTETIAIPMESREAREEIRKRLERRS